MSIFGKLKLSLNKSDAGGDDSTNKGQDHDLSGVKNWYQDRHNRIVVQRNLLFVLTVIAFIVVGIAIVSVVQLATSKQFEPFVIQIEETTGVTTVVNPLSSTVLSGNDEIAKYFIKKYVSARQTYNPVDFDTYAKTTVRLMSTSGIYYQYLNFYKNKANDPKLIYGDKTYTRLAVKSWSKLAENKFMLRFSISEIGETMNKFEKIAIIDIMYVPMALTDEEKEINPIGFQVTGYRVDDDNS